MILAAGRGERMRPLTDRVPKPLLPVSGRPLIAWLLERLAASGFNDIVINVSHLRGAIESALGDGAGLGVRITYSVEPEALETAGGIAWAMPLLGAQPFLVVNGDVSSDFDFGRLRRPAARLSPRAQFAHLVLVDNPPHHPRGDFTLCDGRVSVGDGEQLTFSGIGVYHPTLFSGVARGTKRQLAAVLRGPMGEGRIGGEHYDGRWLDVGTPARLAELERTLRQRA